MLMIWDKGRMPYQACELSVCDWKARRSCQQKNEKVPINAVKSCAEEIVKNCQCLSRHLEQLLKWTIFLFLLHFLIKLWQISVMQSHHVLQNAGSVNEMKQH